jgi:hypothetical protein
MAEVYANLGSLGMTPSEVYANLGYPGEGVGEGSPTSPDIAGIARHRKTSNSTPNEA